MRGKFNYPSFVIGFMSIVILTIVTGNFDFEVICVDILLIIIVYISSFEAKGVGQIATLVACSLAFTILALFSFARGLSDTSDIIYISILLISSGALLFSAFLMLVRYGFSKTKDTPSNRL